MKKEVDDTPAEDVGGPGRVMVPFAFLGVWGKIQIFFFLKSNTF